MAQFPASLPSFNTQVPSKTLAQNGHTAHHNALADEVSAIASKVGIDGSTDASTLTKKVADASSISASNASSIATINSNKPDLSTVTAAIAAGNVDRVDGFHANQTPTANTIPVLNSDKIIPSGSWGSPTYGDGWADYDTGDIFGGAQYVKDSSGFVHMRGLVKNISGASKPANNTLFTLPSSHRSTRNLIFASIAGGVGPVRLEIQKSGEVVCASSVPSNEWVSIACLIFRAE